MGASEDARVEKDLQWVLHRRIGPAYARTGATAPRAASRRPAVGGWLDGEVLVTHSQGYLDAVHDAIAKELADACELRRTIHRSPDLSGEEGTTRDRMLAALDSNRVTLVAETGALVRCEVPGAADRAVAVRAELDALAVHESTGAPFASEHDGIMHACGHDIHLAALYALTRALGRVGGPAPLVAILQPREEAVPSGARDIIDAGALSEIDCQAVIGAHVQPRLAIGTVGCAVGLVNASCDEFEIVVHGVGGHAAYPHTTRDPVAVVAQIVTGLSALRAREVDPVDLALIAVTVLEAGTAPNVSPDGARAAGTIRAGTDSSRTRMLDSLETLVDGVSEGYGCTASVTITPCDPALKNDRQLAEGAGAMLENSGVTVVRDMASAGADDFAFYGTRVPSLMMFVGVAEQKLGRLHAADFLPPDRATEDVARAMFAGYLAGAKRDKDDGTPIRTI